MAASGCQKEGIEPPLAEHGSVLDSLTDGYCIVFGDSTLINHKEIDYYDLSTHMVYLRESHPLLEDRYNLELAYLPFSVFASGDSVYQGVLWPGYSSSIPNGVYIDWPTFFPPNVFQINYLWPYWSYSESDSLEDPRVDARVLAALEKYDQLHQGLTCTLKNLSIDHNQQVSFSFKVTNNDRYNYYILSPDRMGTGLFHYYTNGLYLYSEETGYLQHRITSESPEPWNSWDISWLELLESHTSRNYQITYESFDPVPPGTYRASFRFPGLSHVEAIQLHRTDGRIWLGMIYAGREITLAE